MTDQQPSTETGDAIELSRTLAVLSNPCRRRLLALLLAHRAPISLSALAAHVAAADDFADDLPESARGPESDADSVSVRLHHVHLPALSDGGFVEYDPVDRSIALSPHIDDERAAELVTLADTFDDSATEPAFRLFSSDSMRATLDILVETDDAELHVSTIAARLDAHLGGPQETHAARLRHHLLPKLDAAGIVDYDVTRSAVSLRRNSPLLDASFSPATS